MDDPSSSGYKWFNMYFYIKKKKLPNMSEEDAEWGVPKLMFRGKIAEKHPLPEELDPWVLELEEKNRGPHAEKYFYWGLVLQPLPYLAGHSPYSYTGYTGNRYSNDVLFGKIEIISSYLYFSSFFVACLQYVLNFSFLLDFSALRFLTDLCFSFAAYWFNWIMSKTLAAKEEQRRKQRLANKETKILGSLSLTPPRSAAHHRDALVQVGLETHEKPVDALKKVEEEAATKQAKEAEEVANTIEVEKRPERPAPKKGSRKLTLGGNNEPGRKKGKVAASGGDEVKRLIQMSNLDRAHELSMCSLQVNSLIFSL